MKAVRKYCCIKPPCALDGERALNMINRTLVISTDPAHSLGDALDQDISGGEPVRVVGLDNLSAMEVMVFPSV